ncbi:YozE family protein [Staphylococcus epidermidis]|uniref:YozE family protein n=1 Tax=Staphylococcus epidermidis TaxID=1282 RepID=UPI00119D559B|nr:YozE family protein [Staphylococcus epidermidis]
MQNFLPDHTPLRQLLHSINQHINFPKHLTTQKQIFTYFPNHPSPQNIPLTSIKRALPLFNQFTKL